MIIFQRGNQIKILFCEIALKITLITIQISNHLVPNRLSIAVVFVIFAVEFMNTTANLTKMTAINDNALKIFSITRKFESFRAKKNFEIFF